MVKPKVIGKREGKSKNWLHETSTGMDASLENLNSQIGARSSWGRSIYVDTKVNTDLMGQSINQLLERQRYHLYLKCSQSFLGEKSSSDRFIQLL